ncbi:MAG: hypothetical protein II752_03660 [Muribaculaceae bacterium]|nr:hypothetical protein [Muribaculaceae bacterium]
MATEFLPALNIHFMFPSEAIDTSGSGFIVATFAPLSSGMPWQWRTTTFVGGELSNAGFDEDEKGYAELAKWVPIDSLKDQKFASSLNISAELIAKLLESHG